MKQIGLALVDYEDKRHALPPISTNTDPTPDVPGDATATTDAAHPMPGSAASSGAGYSWIVFILPDMEEGPLYQAIAYNSKRFTLPAFSSEIVSGVSGDAAPHVASVQLAALRCPEFTGGATIDTSKRTVGDLSGTLETGTSPADYDWHVHHELWRHDIAITNYNAILGTHIDDVGPAVAPYPVKSASLPNSNNGGMKFRGTTFGQGFKFAAFTDGTSKVPLVAETRERRFTSWYDGTMNWVVAARHSNPPDGTKAITAANNTTTGMLNNMSVDGRWTVGTDGTSATGGAALNYGPTVEHPTAVYLPSDALADPDISNISPGRLWGPSSEHAGGIVNHVFGDSHVEGISDGIDPNVYLWIVTRNGGEPIPLN